MNLALPLLVGPLLAIAAGTSFVVQQAVNADLSRALGSAVWAGFVSYLGGTLCMLLAALVFRATIPSTGMMAESPWSAWTGGLFGAIYIGTSILLVPRVGAATFVAFLVTGQMLSSLIFDHFGILGLAARSVSSIRILGALLLVAGAILVRL
jgi:bacterial/archaeal transporter family-2 protein